MLDETLEEHGLTISDWKVLTSLRWAERAVSAQGRLARAPRRADERDDDEPARRTSRSEGLVRRLRDPERPPQRPRRAHREGPEEARAGDGRSRGRRRTLLAEALTDREKEQLNALLRKVMITLEDRYPEQARLAVALRCAVAVVGSGPAGFYAAGALLSADPPVEVDMIERLPTPWGLVRLGVAPDHPKLKTVSRAFERIADQPGFRFLGNVEVGRDLHARRPRAPLRRGHLRGRRADRPAARHPRRGPAGLVAGHGVRRLVQRPPRLPGARSSTSTSSGRS